MSKTTVMPITVTIAGQQPTPIRPAGNQTRVQPIATSIVGYDQEITMHPNGLVEAEFTGAAPIVGVISTSLTRRERIPSTSRRADPALRSRGQSA